MYSNVKKANNVIIPIMVLLILIIPTASFAKQVNKESEKICLAKALYHEAKGEPIVGKKGVAKVVLNRTNHKKFPKTICGVVNQVNFDDGRKLCQFSWVCSRKTKIQYSSDSWEDSLDLSDDILNKRVSLPNFGPDVLFFKSIHSRNRWGKGYKLTARLGQSNFYSKKSV
jgi:spore germination cell wall hydrolase CwlJ-like protein